MVKHILKKILCFGLLLSILSPGIIKAADATAVYETEKEIQPRGMICPRCGQYDFVM